MISTTIDAAALQHFQACLHGVLLGPSDAAYDRARRVWNGRIDRYPAVIVRCADARIRISKGFFAPPPRECPCWQRPRARRRVVLNGLDIPLRNGEG
jgi:hypothetical protein